jgi:Tfp pilus assembly protein PilV
MKKLAVLLSLSMSSSLALSSNDNATFELTSAQMDNITAGAGFSGSAAAWAAASGNFPTFFTQTVVNTNVNASRKGFVSSLAMGQATGTEGTATNAYVATNGSGNTRTFNISTDHQGSLFSQSAALEITFSMPNQPNHP